MRLGVLAYSPGGLARYRLGYELRFDPPALVGVLVYIAVITGKVTPACYLQYVLTYRNRHPVVSYSGIEDHGRDGRNSFLAIYGSRDEPCHSLFTGGGTAGQLSQPGAPHIGDPT